MTAPPVWKRGFITTAAVLVVVMGAGVARADVAFRKKAPTSDDTGLEGQPSGGTEAAADDGTVKPLPSASQSDDKDFPEAQQQKEKARADAALARQAKNAELAKGKEGPPIYQKWQFWAVTGAIVVGAVLAIWAGSAVLHEMNGGDIKGCNTDVSPAGCWGEGR